MMPLRSPAELIQASFGAEFDPPPAAVTLADRFTMPPFSVLDARSGEWQARKRLWLELGIRSELGRGEAVEGGDMLTSVGEHVATDGLNYYRDGKKGTGLLGESEQTAEAGLNHYRNKNQRSGLARTFGQDLMRGEHVVGQGQKAVRAIADSEWLRGLNGHDSTGNCAQQSGTSIFDPVLCELAYRWFSPPSGAVLDPFAGGSVRGIVAATLGRSYTGVDLSERQLAANREQAAAIRPPGALLWICGDSQDLTTLAAGAYDFVFTCPPYFDLEVYSDDPRDLSTMTYPAFLDAYRAIIRACADALREDRFACFVVGDIRDGRGCYRNFVSETVAAFAAAGMPLYNDAILVTMVGSLPIRVGRQFERTRKLGKTHQNVLTFVKGDPKRAAAACAEVLA